MQTGQNVFKPLLAVLLLAGLASCNNNSDPDKTAAAAMDSTKMADSAKMAETSKMADTSKMAAAPMKMEVPFNIAEVQFTVKDYKSWHEHYMLDSAERTASGMHEVVVAKEVGTNGVEVVATLDDVSKGKAFMANPDLKVRMVKGGVIGKPDVKYVKILRFNNDSKEKQWVEVWHQVKDYDAWLKVYDAEGAAARESQGMIDFALGRGIDDPSWVLLVFDIKDMAKAKAAMMSDEKKKLMMSAGVMGKPVIKYYGYPE